MSAVRKQLLYLTKEIRNILLELQDDAAEMIFRISRGIGRVCVSMYIDVDTIKIPEWKNTEVSI